MTTENKRPGRPRSEHKLTPAEKQAAYRQRRGARDAVIQSDADFKKSFEYEINYQIALALKNYQLATGNDKEANFHQLNALKRFKFVIESKHPGWKHDEYDRYVENEYRNA